MSTISGSTSANMNDIANLADVEQMTSGGGAGGGNMPQTNVNNSYTGTVVIIVADTMAGAANVSFADIWTFIQLQHPIIENNALTRPMQLTIDNFDFYGCTSGVIAFQPAILPPPTDSGAPVGSTIWGQQFFDVGTLMAKPHISWSWRNNINATRRMQAGPPATAGNNLDIIFSYQTSQVDSAPFTADVSYIRITFKTRYGVTLNLANMLPPPTAGLTLGTPGITTQQLRDNGEKGVTTRLKAKKIRAIKELTLPTIDK